MSKMRYIVLILLMALLCASGVLGAEPETEADPLGEGKRYGGAGVSYDPDGYVTVHFAAWDPKGMPDYSSGSVQADVGVSAGAFVGDYVAADIEGLTFKLMGDGHVPKDAMVILRSSVSGRIWRNENVQVSKSAGLWFMNTIPLQRDAGWTRDGPGDLDAMWAADLTSVDMIGIRLVQNGHEAQSYSIDDFRLFGEGFITDEAVLIMLRMYFGVDSVDDLTAEQKQRDLDDDGMVDWKEILAGTNPEDASSIFAIEMSKDGAGIILRWPCLKGAKYSVLKTTNMVKKMFLPLVSDLEAAETGFMTHRDENASGRGPYFYRILKQ